MTTKVIGLGAGGHAKVVVEILGANNRFDLIGLLDSETKRHGQTLLGVPILGNDDELPICIARGVTHFFVGVGSIGSTALRQRLYTIALQHGLLPIRIIHPQAIISPSASLGEGATVMANAVINAEAVIGANALINTGAIIEHDCVIGDHVHVAIGARLAGAVIVGTGAHIGAGATVRQCVLIGDNAIIGAGAVVVNDVPDKRTVVGVPARIVG